MVPYNYKIDCKGTKKNETKCRKTRKSVQNKNKFIFKYKTVTLTTTVGLGDGSAKKKEAGRSESLEPPCVTALGTIIDRRRRE